MKFKNSHILLVSLISIFLLLSISAASAADSDIAADNSSVDIVEIEDINIKESHYLCDDASTGSEDLSGDENTSASGTDDATGGNDTDATGGDDTGNATSVNGTENATDSNGTNGTNGTNATNNTKYDGPVTNVIIIPVSTSADYQYGNFTFKVVDNATGEPLANQKISVSGVYFFTFNNGSSISTTKVFTTNSNGLLVIANKNLNKNLDTLGMVYNFTALDVGKYDLTFSGNDSLKIVVNNTLPITVNKVNAEIKASNFKDEVGTSKKYTFKLVNKNTGTVIKLASLKFQIKLNSSGYTTYNATTNLSGQVGYNLNLLAGTYPVRIVNNDSNLKASTISRNVTLTKKVGVLSASNRTILYNSAPTAIIKLTDKKTGKAVAGAVLKVRVYTTSKKYSDLAFYTDNKGQVSFKAALSLGKHKMIISTLDNNYTASSITRYVTLKKTTGKISAPKISATYKSGKLYTITLKNAKNGNAMYGSTLNIKIFVNSKSYYKYTGMTDGNGKVNINTSSLKPGTYKVSVSSGDSGFTAKAATGQIKITKIPTKLSPTAYKEKYNSGKTFKIKVTNKNTNKIISGIKVTVKVYTSTKKYKTYTVKTTNKGIAYLKVTQKPGTYKTVVSLSNAYYSASAVTSKITVTK